MKRFHIYKASIDTYRVLDTLTGEFVVQSARFITVPEPSFVVDQEGYKRAGNDPSGAFINSGDPRDYFAYIACDSYELGVRHPLPVRIKFNPFKANFFFIANSGLGIDASDVCVLMGNELYVNRAPVVFKNNHNNWTTVFKTIN